MPWETMMRKAQNASRGFLLALLSCLVASAPLLAQSEAAHEWSVDQRLKMRFDPSSMEKRLEALGMSPDPYTSIVDGSKNPELLLHFELFLVLLQGGFDDDQDARKSFRARIEPRASDLGIGPELWTTLREVTSGLFFSTSSPTWEEECRNQFEALAAARKAFGKESFDRMLYKAVAPEVKVTLTGNLPELEQQIRDMESGCREPSRTPDAPAPNPGGASRIQSKT